MHREAAKLPAKHDPDGDGGLSAEQRQAMKQFQSRRQGSSATLDDPVRWHQAQRARTILGQVSKESREKVDLQARTAARVDAHRAA